MGTHDGLIEEITDQSTRFFKRSEDLKLFLAFAQTSTEDETRWSSASRDARALAIVCTMAELEALTKFIIQRVHEDLNDRALAVSDLIPSVRQLVAHTTFESLRTLQAASRMWTERSYVTTLESCVEIAKFPVQKRNAQPPLDGKTLKPEHFERLWTIYRLPGYAFPRAAWDASLKKLAYARNDLAHGNLPYHEIFQQAGRSLSDIELYLDDLSNFTKHLVATWLDYLSHRMYLNK